MKRIWIYLQNPFFNCTKNNYKKAVKISTYTDAQLFAKSTDPFYGPMYTAYHPLHLALVSTYNIWKAQGGTQKGSTVTITDLLAQLSPEKSGIWSRAVQLLHPIGSAIYTAIFPMKMFPFYRGTKLARINAVSQLEIALTGKVGLETTLTDVTAFAGALGTANISQTGNIGNTTNASTNVETARANAMVMLYNILGQGIAHFAATPNMVTVLFNLNVIRNNMQTIFTGTLKRSFFETIAQRTFALDDTIDATNDGGAILGFYLAENAGQGPAGYTVVRVLCAKTDTLKVSDFVGNTTNNFLSVVNLSETLSGHFNVNVA